MDDSKMSVPGLKVQAFLLNVTVIHYIILFRVCQPFFLEIQPKNQGFSGFTPPSSSVPPGIR
mgnify:FL=1